MSSFVLDVLRELVDRFDFSELSDVEELSDDENGDPTWEIHVKIPPRISCFEELEGVDEVQEAEEGPCPSEEEHPTIEEFPAPQAVTNPPPPPTQPASWHLADGFEPLPPAPPFEPPQDRQYVRNTIDLFKKYITNEVLEGIALATNASIMANTGKIVRLSKTDIEKFIGITLMMSYLKYPRIKMYWANQTRVPQIADVMPRNKYFCIRNHFRCRDYASVTPDEKTTTKFWKVAPVVNSVRSGCLRNEKSSVVSIDEQMIPFWGHVLMRQHVKGKPNPCGLKNYVACAPDGLPLDFFLYEGKGDTILPPDFDLQYPNLNISGKVIVRLTENLPQGVVIYMDRFFTSVDLFDELHTRGFQATGTITLDKVPWNAPLYTDAELRRGGRGYYCQVVRECGQISIVKWFDNKPVLLISSVDGTVPADVCRRWCKKSKQYVEVRRPYIVKVYNESMGGVDMLDRMISYYRISARTKKWTVRLLFHLIDFAAAAGWLERRRADEAERTPKKDRFDYLDFRADLAYQLLNSVPEEDMMSIEEDVYDIPNPPARVTPLPHDSVRTKNILHLPELPPDAKPSRCRLPGCKSPKCRVKCSTCNVFLCLNANRNCFKEFHRQ